MRKRNVFPKVNETFDVPTLSSQHEALKFSSDISPAVRKDLQANYENKNKSSHIHLAGKLEEPAVASTVYLDFHKGRGDPKVFAENCQKSLLYKDRIISHQHTLGLDNDRDLQKNSLKGLQYKRITSIDKTFAES